MKGKPGMARRRRQPDTHQSQGRQGWRLTAAGARPASGLDARTGEASVAAAGRPEEGMGLSSGSEVGAVQRLREKDNRKRPNCRKRRRHRGAKAIGPRPLKGAAAAARDRNCACASRGREAGLPNCACAVRPHPPSPLSPRQVSLACEVLVCGLGRSRGGLDWGSSPCFVLDFYFLF